MAALPMICFAGSLVTARPSASSAASCASLPAFKMQGARWRLCSRSRRIGVEKSQTYEPFAFAGCNAVVVGAAATMMIRIPRSARRLHAAPHFHKLISRCVQHDELHRVDGCLSFKQRVVGRRWCLISLGLVNGVARPLSSEGHAGNSQNQLLDKNQAMNGFLMRFMAGQDSLKNAVGARKQEAIKDAVDTILDFFANDAVWAEVGPIGEREKNIWATLQTTMQGTYSSESSRSNGDSVIKSVDSVDMLFLNDYYAFWRGFNDFFEIALTSMDAGLPGSRDMTQSPHIDALVEIDRRVAAYRGNVAHLIELFADIQSVRKYVGQSSDIGVSGDIVGLSSDALSKAISVVRSFCQDGEYMDGLGSLIGPQSDLLEALRAPDVRTAIAKAPDTTRALIDSSESREDSVRSQILKLLYDMQGVFLFVNRFQEQVVGSLVKSQDVVH